MSFIFQTNEITMRKSLVLVEAQQLARALLLVSVLPVYWHSACASHWLLRLLWDSVLTAAQVAPSYSFTFFVVSKTEIAVFGKYDVVKHVNTEEFSRLKHGLCYFYILV